MRWFRADLHIHTVLSPCGSLEMSPVNIVRQAMEKNLDIIAITDHNSTRHCGVTRQIAERYGITVIAGAEVNTREEIHCLALFQDLNQAADFQLYLDRWLTIIPNDAAVFGPQYVVDEHENIIGEEERLLVAALQTGIEDVEKEVHRLNGLFIPAHINRFQNGLYNQLGFLPEGLKADALEVLRNAGCETFLRDHPETQAYPLCSNSDAHTLRQIGNSVNWFYLERPCFEEMQYVFNRNDRQGMKCA